MEWYQYLSDSFLNEAFTAIAANYKVLAMLLAGPVLWIIKKFTGWTPWTTDDKLGDMIEQKLGLKK